MATGFQKPSHTIEPKRESPLGPYIDEFAQQLCEQGYSRQYALRPLQLVAELSQWLKTAKDLVVSDLTVDASGELPLEFRARSRTHPTW